MTTTTTITITLQDLAGVLLVQTDAAAPAIGQSCTPAQALAMDLLRTCRAQASAVQYGQSAATLAGELLASRAEAWLHVNTQKEPA